MGAKYGHAAGRANAVRRLLCAELCGWVCGRRSPFWPCPYARQTPALGFIFVTILIDVIGLGLIIPVVPKLIQQLTGEGLSRASEYSGWLTFAYASAQFCFAPVVGGLSDKLGRRPVLLAALLGLGLDYIFLSFPRPWPSCSWGA